MDFVGQQKNVHCEMCLEVSNKDILSREKQLVRALSYIRQSSFLPLQDVLGILSPLREEKTKHSQNESTLHGNRFRTLRPDKE